MRNIKKIINHLGVQLQINFIGMLFLMMLIVFIFLFFSIKDIMIQQIGNSRLDVLKQVAERSNSIKNNIITTSNLYGYDQNIITVLKQKNLSEAEEKSFVSYLDNINKNYNHIFQDSKFQHDVSIIASNNFKYYSFNKIDYDFEKLESQLWYRQNFDEENNIVFVSFSENRHNKKSICLVH